MSEEEEYREITMIDSLKAVAETIDNGQYTVVYTPSSCQHGGLAYTVGMTERGLPEVIVTGLPPESAAQVIANALDHIIPNGAPAEGARLSEVLETYDVEFHEASTRFLAIVKEIFPLSDIKAVQLVWPDREGRFYSDPGCDLDDHIQPRLYPKEMIDA